MVEEVLFVATQKRRLILKCAILLYGLITLGLVLMTYYGLSDLFSIEILAIIFGLVNLPLFIKNLIFPKTVLILRKNDFILDKNVCVPYEQISEINLKYIDVGIKSIQINFKNRTDYLKFKKKLHLIDWIAPDFSENKRKYDYEFYLFFTGCDIKHAYEIMKTMIEKDK